MDNSLIITILEYVFKYGIFALLFVGLLLAIGYAFWVWGGRLVEKYLVMMDSLGSSNERFAESSEKMSKLVEILVSQQESTLQQLKFIKDNLNKQNLIAVDFTRILMDLNKESPPEITIRLENIIKEIQR